MCCTSKKSWCFLAKDARRHDSKIRVKAQDSKRIPESRSFTVLMDRLNASHPAPGKLSGYGSATTVNNPEMVGQRDLT